MGRNLKYWRTNIWIGDTIQWQFERKKIKSVVKKYSRFENESELKLSVRGKRKKYYILTLQKGGFNFFFKQKNKPWYFSKMVLTEKNIF